MIDRELFITVVLGVLVGLAVFAAIRWTINFPILNWWYRRTMRVPAEYYKMDGSQMCSCKNCGSKHFKPIPKCECSECGSQHHQGAPFTIVGT